MTAPGETVDAQISRLRAIIGAQALQIHAKDLQFQDTTAERDFYEKKLKALSVVLEWTGTENSDVEREKIVLEEDVRSLKTDMAKFNYGTKRICESVVTTLDLVQVWGSGGGALISIELSALINTIRVSLRAVGEILETA